VLKHDIWIRNRAEYGMITPFQPELIRRSRVDQELGRAVLSYGCSSYGYDIRLSPKQFKVFRHVPGTIMDPKCFNPKNLEEVELLHDPTKGDYFILPAHSYGLGVALEHLVMPPNVTAICLGKSTYARMGVIANMTPAEAGWQGHLTLEFSNSSGADCRLYANEGICQLLFFEGEPCDVSYANRAGKYQGQSEEVTLARV
jgi:dCTP deaminase